MPTPQPPESPRNSANNKSPEALFLRFLDTGDERALKLLMRRCSPRLRSFARRFGVPDDRIEDLVHESLVTAVQKATDFERGRPLLPWLQGILTRKVASYVRSEARRARHQTAWAHARGHTSGQGSPTAPSSSPLDSAARSELFAILQEAILAVPEHYRTALELHLLEGLSPVEVAERLGRMRTTIRVQLFRGLRALRRQLPRGLHPLLFALLLAPDRRALAAAIGEAPALGRRTLLGVGTVLAVAMIPAVAWWSEPDPKPATPPITLTADATRTESAYEIIAGQSPTLSASTSSPAVPEPVASQPRIDAGRELEVVVIDQDRRPVAAVGLWLEPLDGSDPLATRQRAITASNGIARFTDLPRLAMRLRSDRSPAQEIAATATHAQVTVRGVRVTGTVLAPTGSPCSDASIWLGGDVVTTTNAQGRFALDAVPPGSAIAAIAPFGVAAPRAVAVTAVPLVLQLEPAGAVAGQVLDSSDNPVQGARIVVGSAPDHAEEGFADDALMCLQPTQTATTASDGTFGPLWLGAGEHSLHIRTARTRPHAATVVITPLEMTTARIELPAATRLRGRVVDLDGDPIASARIAFRGANRSDRIDTIADAAGRFRLNVPSSGGFVGASANGFRPARVVLSNAVPQPSELTVILTPERWQSVYLAFPDGTPVAGWAVRWLTPTYSALDRGEQRVVTDPSGHCKVAARDHAAVEASTLPSRWAVRGPGDPIWHEQPRTALQSDGSLLRATITTNLRPSVTLTAECLDARGRPMVQGRAYLKRNRDIFWESARTDNHGRFTVGPLAPGDYSVFVESTAPDQPSLLRSGVSLLANATSHETLQAEPGGRLEYELRQPDGSRVEAAIVTFVGGDANRRYGTREHGHGSQRLPTGNYSLFAMGEDFTWVHGEPFAIGRNRTTKLSVTVEPATRRALLLDVPGFGVRPLTATVQRSGDGREFGRFYILEDAPPGVIAFLPAGNFEVLVTDESRDTSWQGRFSVTSLARQHEAVRVSFTTR